jgi:hypothetical protein
MSKPTVPKTPIVQLYRDLHAERVGRQRRLELAREYVAEPSALAAMFADSVEPHGDVPAEGRAVLSGAAAAPARRHQGAAHH